MNSEKNNPIEQLKSIQQMMERSSRFVSLSGWSGICAGLFALIGAYLANYRVTNYYKFEYGTLESSPKNLFTYLLLLALCVFICAVATAFLFTFIRSKKNNIPVWGESARRLMWNTLLPIVVGGVFILKMASMNWYHFVAPACLIFYGLGLVNGSKYTLGEVRYLGYSQLILGLINLFFLNYGLLFWALGFGAMHVIYGAAMWWKYERINHIEE